MIESFQILVRGVLAGGLLLASATSSAREPDNGDAPWKAGIFQAEVSLYAASSSSGVSWGGSEDVGSSSDVDYIFLGCKGRNLATVGVTFFHSVGDLDIHVYDIGGAYLGGSFGVTNLETVDVRAFGKEVVVVQVYGYNGATGGYSPVVYCQ